MRKRRVAGWALTALLGLVALAGIALWAGLSSDRVARNLLAKGLARAGNSVQIGQIRGTLNGPLILNDVRIRTDVFAATVDSVLLDWTPIGLVRREVRVDRLHVTGLHVTLPDSTPRDTAAEPRRPELPMKVLLGDVVITDIVVDAPGDIGLRDGWARLGGTADEYQLVARGRAFTPQLDSVPFTLGARGNLEQLVVDSAEVRLLDGEIATGGRVSWWPRVSWNLALEATDVHPGVLLADPAGWRGEVSALAKTSGFLDSAGAHGLVVVDSLGGEMRGQPLSGTGRFDLDGTTTEILALDVGWGSADLEATGTVGADALDLRFDAAVGNLGTVMPGARGSLLADGTVTGPPEAARVRADLSGRNVQVGANSVARLEGTADVGMAPDGAANLDLRGTGARAGQLAIEQLALEMRGTRTSHRITAEATSSEVDATLAASGGLRGTTWSGTLGDLTVAADALGVWRLEQPSQVTAGTSLVRVQQLCIAGDAESRPRICAAGDWRGNYDWSADATLERLPLALLDSLVPDTAQGGGRALEGMLEGDVDVAAAGGRLQGLATLRAVDAAVLFPIPGDTAPERVEFDTAGAEVRFDGSGARGAATFRFASADGTPIGNVTATGALPRYTSLRQRLQDQVLEARLDAVMEDLSLAGVLDARIDSLTGRMTLNGTASGTVGAPQVNAAMGLEEIVAWLADARVARGSMEATLDGGVARDGSLAGTLTAIPRGVIYEYPLADVRRTVAIDSGGLEVTASEAGLRAVLGLGLSDSAAARMARIAADLSLPEYDRFGEPLGPQPLALRFTADLADLAVLQTVIQQFDTLTGRLTADLTVEGTVGAPVVDGTLEVREMVALFPHGGAITGGLDANLGARVARDSTITGNLTVTPADLALRVTQDDTVRFFPIDSTGLSASVDGAGARGELAVRISEPDGAAAGVLGGRVQLPGYTRVGAPIDGQAMTGSLRARVDDLAFVEGLTAQVDSAAGSLQLDAALGGTVADPRGTGELVLRDGAARIPLLGVLYDDIRLDARADDSETFNVDGSLRSGGGSLSLTGSYPLRATVHRPATLRLQGTDFEAVRTADVHAVVTPDLTIVLTGDSIGINGEVTVPLARVELAEIPEFAVAPSEDVVFVHDTAALEPGPQALAARVRIVLGDSVTFRGFNFTAELGGGLLFVQEPEQIATASGEVVIEEGHYRAYGQDLTIENGTLRFAGGPVDDPGLAIRATRTADDGTVAGLQIGGTLQDPLVTIFSEPAMSQSRALAYIILGRAPGEGTGGGGALLSKAATSLGLRGSNALARRLGEGLGLSQATIEAEDGAGSATFVAGTYLAPDVYISYGIGLFDPATRLRIRYEISPRWAIQAERGAATGADVLFTTERGR